MSDLESLPAPYPTHPPLWKGSSIQSIQSTHPSPSAHPLPFNTTFLTIHLYHPPIGLSYLGGGVLAADDLEKLGLELGDVLTEKPVVVLQLRALGVGQLAVPERVNIEVQCELRCQASVL